VSKAISKIGKKATIAKTQSSDPRMMSTLPALPFGFTSLFGLLAYGLLCVMMLAAPYLFSGFWPVSYEYWPQAMFLALTACACVLLALAPLSKIKDQRSKTEILLTLFFVWCVLSISRTVYLHDSLLEIARVTGVVTWFFIARTLLANPQYFARRVAWLFFFIVAGTIWACIIGFLQYLQRPDRVFSTFYNPNLFANYCALVLPLAVAGVLALWRQSKRRNSFPAPAIGGVFVLAIIALGLFLTSSKGGLLATLCGLLIFSLAVFKAKGAHVREVLRARRGAVAIISLFVFVVGGVLFSQTILPRLSSNIQNDYSTMFRYYTWRGTLRMAAARPLLGFGPGSFPSAYTRFAETGYTRTAHELWLQVAAESGFPATLFLLAACGASALAGWRALKTENWIFAAGALGALAAFFIHGLTDAGWSIISIATLAMIAFAIADCGLRIADSSIGAPSGPNRQSSINWFWLLAALPIALGSWVAQRAQTGEDLRAESRELIARGAVLTAVEKAHAALSADPISSRLMYDYAQALETARQDAVGQYTVVAYAQRTRALNWLSLAEYSARHHQQVKLIPQFYEMAITLDPNDTEIRLARGKWKLDHNDLSGWQDIEYIASLKDKPYGKYPATPEMVDLNFARAYAMLAERDFKSKKFAETKKWITRGLEVIAEGRKWEPQRRDMEQATQGAIDYSREQTMDELEAQLKALQEKIP
jgi:O-antigen ligase